MPKNRIIKLSAEHDGRMRLLSSFELADSAVVGQNKWVTVTRTGTFTDPRYGTFEITRAMLWSMVANFKANVVGQEIFIDVNHQPGNGAAATVKELAVEGDRLRAMVVFTEFGIEAVRSRGFRYLSAEYHENFVDNESGKAFGPTLLGAGLTVRPVLKRLDPVQLSESDLDFPTLIHPTLLKLLTQEGANLMAKWLKDLIKQLSALGLSDATVKTLASAAQTAAAGLGEDEAKLMALAESFLATGNEIVKTPGMVQLSVTTPTADMGLVGQEVARILAQRDADTLKLAQTAETHRGEYRTLLLAQKFDDTAIKALSEFEAMIDANTTPDQLKRIVALAIKTGNDAAVSAQLRQLGMGAPVGSPRISMDSGSSIKKLCEAVRENLRHTGNRNLSLPTAESVFAQKYLAHYDSVNERVLLDEAKKLSGGVVNTGDMSLPATFNREVIREALSDVQILDLVDASVDPTTAATHTIPYESRDVSAVMNNGIVYQGQPIHQASTSQLNDFAYILQMKLAMEITNEAAFFSATSQLNWDAMGSNVASNATLLRQLIARRLSNEWVRTADAYAAIAVVTDTLTAQCNGTRSTFKLTSFPVVRPFQERDLNGAAIGSVENPVTITYNSVAATEYDGTGTQAAGNYWRITNANMGLFQIVTQAGVLVVPPNTTPLVANAYSYATNIVKVDSDIPVGVEDGVHYDRILHAVGARKALLKDDRYSTPNFLHTSMTLHNTMTLGRSFTADGARPGISATAVGDLGTVRGMGTYSTAAATDVGEERALIGERGSLKYRIAKPYVLGQLTELFNSSGKFIGKRGAYGEEYSSIKVPLPLRNRTTSVIVYSATGRAAL